MLRLTSAKTILTAGVLVGATLLATGCETTTTRSSLSTTTPIAGEDAFESGAGQPPTARTLYRMGMILTAQQKLAGAEAVHRSTIRRYPDFLPSYSELARLQIKRGAAESAIETFDRALMIAAADPVVHNNRGMCLMLLERYEEAQESFAVASAAAPDNTRYDANLALASGMLGDYDEALGLYMEFLQPSRAHYNLGVICEALDDHERAAIEYARAAGGELVADEQADSQPMTQPETQPHTGGASAPVGEDAGPVEMGRSVSRR